jgi:hypothetical protein
MMEAASTSETSVNFYQTTRRNNSEDSHLHTRRRENQKSRKEGLKLNGTHQLLVCAGVNFIGSSTAFMLTVLARLTLSKTISRYFNCVTFVLRVCRVVTCDCASWQMEYDVYTQLPKISRPLPRDLANTFEKVTLRLW